MAFPAHIRRLRVLVIRSSAMGDVAMTASVLAEAARRHPQLEMVMLTRGFYAPFFDGVEGLRIHPIDLSVEHRGARGTLRLYRELRRTYPGVRMVLDLNDKIYSKLIRLFYRLSGVRTYRIYKGRKEKKALTAREGKVLRPLESTVERYADVFRAAGFSLPPISRDLSKYRRPDRPLPAGLGLDLAQKTATGLIWLGVAPFAKHVGKVYPFQKMEEVIASLTERYGARLRGFVFGGGAQDRLKAELLMERFPQNVTSVVGRIDLRQELDLMAHLDLMLSMDSSAMHMASLVGLPVVSVWGATHPYAGFLGLGQSIENAVGVGLAEGVECRPCSVFGNKPCWRTEEGGQYRCLALLEPPKIVSKIVEAISSLPQLSSSRSSSPQV